MDYKELCKKAFSSVRETYPCSDHETALKNVKERARNMKKNGNIQQENVKEIPVDFSATKKSTKIIRTIAGIAGTAAVLTGAIFGLNWLNEHGGLREGGIESSTGAGYNKDAAWSVNTEPAITTNALYYNDVITSELPDISEDDLGAETTTATTPFNDDTTASSDNAISSISSESGETTVSNTSISPVNDDMTSSEPNENSSTTTTQEQVANGPFIGTGDNDVQLPRVVPMISSYGDSSYSDDIAVNNGYYVMSESLEGALEEYRDTVNYRVFVELFRDGTAIDSSSPEAQAEITRLGDAGYIVAYETFFDGSAEHYYFTLHAKYDQIIDFSVNAELGYFLSLYGEHFDNAADDPVVFNSSFDDGVS